MFRRIAVASRPVVSDSRVRKSQQADVREPAVGRERHQPRLARHRPPLTSRVAPARDCKVSVAVAAGPSPSRRRRTSCSLATASPFTCVNASPGDDARGGRLSPRPAAPPRQARPRCPTRDAPPLTSRRRCVGAAAMQDVDEREAAACAATESSRQLDASSALTAAAGLFRATTSIVSGSLAPADSITSQNVPSATIRRRNERSHALHVHRLRQPRRQIAPRLRRGLTRPRRQRLARQIERQPSRRRSLLRLELPHIGGRRPHQSTRSRSSPARARPRRADRMTPQSGRFSPPRALSAAPPVVSSAITGRGVSVIDARSPLPHLDAPECRVPRACVLRRCACLHRRDRWCEVHRRSLFRRGRCRGARRAGLNAADRGREGEWTGAVVRQLLDGDALNQGLMTRLPQFNRVGARREIVQHERRGRIRRCGRVTCPFTSTSTSDGCVCSESVADAHFRA